MQIRDDRLRMSLLGGYHAECMSVERQAMQACERICHSSHPVPAAPSRAFALEMHQAVLKAGPLGRLSEHGTAMQG